MATVDTSKTPYNDRFSTENDYTKILFNHDRPLQASELTELQSILGEDIGRIGSTVMIDGDLQSGMDYRISEGTITINSGQVFLAGKVRTFREQTIPFNATGEFKACIQLDQKVVTSMDDETLLDQTSGVTSYFSAGADRLKETVVLTADSTAGVPIYEFVDGELVINKSSNNEMSKITDVLAERTNDESGSYKVRGFNIYSEEHPTDQNKIMLIVDSGRAYVLGYQVDKPTSTRIPLDKALDSNTVNSEAFYYNNSTRRGKLGNSPVSTVNRVTAQVQVTKETTSRGATADSTDSLNNSSVTGVSRVWTESGGSTSAEFRQGIDFQIMNGNSIDWSPSGNEPNSGTTYYVTYTYNKTLVKDTDYKITTEGNLDNRQWYIDFNGLTGNKPVANTMVTVDYTYFLAREDLISLDKDGNVIVQKGQPASLNSVKKPSSTDPFTLVLGSITIYPDSNTTIPHKSTITRLSMLDLQNMKNRIENLEYNDAVNALDQPAMAGVNPTVLRGVFSDGFISLDKYDSSHPDANIGFSFEDAEITLPYASAKKTQPNLAVGSTNAHIWGRLVTAPFTEVKEISQPFATETMNINPYNTYNKQGIMKLDPSEDNWIEESRVTVTQQETDTLKVRRWWGGHRNDPWVEDEMEMVSNITLDAGQTWGGDSSLDKMQNGSWTRAGAMTGTTLESGGTRTIDAKIEYMRQIDVQFEVANLLPNSNNLEMLFDGIRVALTPATGFNKGAAQGTIMSNSTGQAKGTFKIPAGVRTGTREVILQNGDNLAVGTFIAQGTHKTIEDVIIRTRVSITLIDPLAQSFQFMENKVVSSFGVFFASKDPVHNVNVQVRGITPGGTPDKTIYAETLLTPSQIKISNDGTAETKVVFDDPLVVTAGKEYALVLITDTDKYTIWTAKRGQNDIKTGTTMTSNPYLTGVLYSSSNASAWTIHQDHDMTFNVYTARFNPTATLEFDTMTDVSADAVVLMATYLTPQSTGCTWDVKMVMDNEAENVTVANKQWMPLANYDEIELNQIAREVKLRATFTTNQNMSPMLSLSDILFTSFLSELSGSYISRSIDTSEAPFNTVNLSYEAFTPSNTTVKPRMSFDGGKTWKDFKTQPVTTQQTGEFTEYKYSEKVTEDTNGLDSIKFRLDFTTQNSFARGRARKLMSTFIYE